MNGGLVTAEYLFLALPPPDFKVGGNLTCVATNQIGTTVRTVEVIVQRKSVSKCSDDVSQISLCFLSLGRAQNVTFITSPAQNRLVGETAILECNVSLVVSTAREFAFDWGLAGGGRLPAERTTFTQNKQTLILTNLTIQDSQLYFCDVFAPSTFDFFRINYRLNVFGEPYQ